MKIFGLFIPAAFSEWSQPKYYDIVNSDKSRSNSDWGHSIEGRKAAHWIKCPEMETPPGAIGVTCNRATCAVMCPPGSRAIGQRRTRCRINRENGKFWWTQKLAGCNTCSEQEPQSTDPLMTTSCKVNKETGRRFCKLQCPSNYLAADQKQRFVKINCKCINRGATGCDWYHKNRLANYGQYKCFPIDGATTTTTTTTSTTTTTTTTEPPTTTTTTIEPPTTTTTVPESGVPELTTITTTTAEVVTDDPLEEEEEVLLLPEVESCETTLASHDVTMVPSICSTLGSINAIRTAASEPELTVDFGAISAAQSLADGLSDSNPGNANGPFLAGQLAYSIMAFEMSRETLATLAMESWEENEIAELTGNGWAKFGLAISEAPSSLGILINYYVTAQFE